MAEQPTSLNHQRRQKPGDKAAAAGHNSPQQESAKETKAGRQGGSSRTLSAHGTNHQRRQMQGDKAAAAGHSSRQHKLPKETKAGRQGGSILEAHPGSTDLASAAKQHRICSHVPPVSPVTEAHGSSVGRPPRSPWPRGCPSWPRCWPRPWPHRCLRGPPAEHPWRCRASNLAPFENDGENDDHDDHII